MFRSSSARNTVGNTIDDFGSVLGRIYMHSERGCAEGHINNLDDSLLSRSLAPASSESALTSGFSARRRGIPDKQLAAVGVKRNSWVRVPYFGVALQCLPGTELVLTLTGGMTSVIKNDRRLRLVKAPPELQAFHFLMAWHPRLTSDPRHVWLRGAMRSTAAARALRKVCAGPEALICEVVSLLGEQTTNTPLDCHKQSRPGGLRGLLEW
jgi:hypothetical protein